MLDLIVPGEMGAADAIDQLAGLDPTIKAILVSGYAQDSVLSAFRDRGFQAVITKPYTLQELRATLNSVMTVPMWRVH
jgi:two-component system cell cycle sensor histidine kinase/response regulator CckA